MHQLGTRGFGNSFPRPHDRDDYKAQSGCKRLRYKEITTRLRSNTPDTLEITQPCDSERDRREHQRNDDHEQHPQEDLPNRSGEIFVDASNEWRISTEQRVCADAKDGTHKKTQQDLRVELHSLPCVTDRFAQASLRCRSARRETSAQR